MRMGDVAVAGPVNPGAVPLGQFARPLDPQTKAGLLAEMPFVSEAVADDISDLADATATGKGRRTMRIGVGLALGIGGTLAFLYLKRRMGV